MALVRPSRDQAPALRNRSGTWRCLQHYVYFVRVLVSMDSLPLTRLKTIHIAKHLVGLAQIDLGHSLAGESHCLSDVLKNHLLGFLDFSFNSFSASYPGGELGFNAGARPA